jgi:hypothetical protein
MRASSLEDYKPPVICHQTYRRLLMRRSSRVVRYGHDRMADSEPSNVQATPQSWCLLAGGAR